MELGLIVTIVISFIAISISVYIAYRQGAFKKTYLFFSAGVSTKDDKKIDKKLRKKNKPIWAMVAGIPDLVMDYYIIILPYLIDNTGDKPIKNMLVQFRYRSDFDCSDFNFAKNTNNFPDWIDYGIKRGVKKFGKMLLVEYSIPLLTPATPYHIQDYIAVKKTMFNDERTNFEKKILKDSPDNKFILEEIKCTSYSENLKPVKFNTWLLITLSNDTSELIKRTRNPLDKLHEKNCPSLFGPGIFWVPPFWSFWYSLMFPKCRKEKPFIYMQSSAVKLLKEKESSNVIMQSFEKTEISFASINWKFGERLITKWLRRKKD